MNILFFDTETTGVPKDYNAPITDSENWPRMVQIAVLLTDENGNELSHFCSIVKPDGFTIPEGAIEVHGISNWLADTKGKPIKGVLSSFVNMFSMCDLFVGHNISFDRKIVGAELLRYGHDDYLHGKPRICTMMKSTKYCAIPAFNRAGFKWPKLTELHQKLFGESFEGAHDALADIRATAKCFFELRRLGVISQSYIEETVNKVW